MEVRPARDADVATLVRHCLGVAKESEGLHPDEAVVGEAVQAAVADPAKARYFVALDSADVVGSLFVTYEWSDWRNGWYWWVQGVYVEPAWRRRGVMRTLFSAVREAARQQGDVRLLRLYVEQDNPARAAYEALGWQETPYRIYEEAL